MFCFFRIYSSYKELSEDSDVEVRVFITVIVITMIIIIVIIITIIVMIIIIIIIMIIIMKSSTHHFHDNQIAYIGVISPAHKHLVHLMLDAGKVCFCKLILISIDFC